MSKPSSADKMMDLQKQIDYLAHELSQRERQVTLLRQDLEFLAREVRRLEVKHGFEDLV